MPIFTLPIKHLGYPPPPPPPHIYFTFLGSKTMKKSNGKCDDHSHMLQMNPPKAIT